MTAPGDTVLLILLLAVFVACSAYAAGRIHQRRQTGDDRDEAYRDGYETGTRNVFSLATRAITSRRAARAAVPVPDAAPAEADAPPESSLPEPPPPPPAAAGFPAPPPVSVGFPAPQPPPPNVIAQPAAPGGVSYRPFPDPRQPAVLSPLLGPARRDPVVSYGDLIKGRDVSEAVTEEPAADPSVSRRSAASRSRHGLPEPRREAAGGPWEAAGSRTNESPAQREEDAGTESEGRHTAPDALIQGVTYRLPADRVFRARVPDGETLAEQPTRVVPKPRQS